MVEQVFSDEEQSSDYCGTRVTQTIRDLYVTLQVKYVLFYFLDSRQIEYFLYAHNLTV